MPATTLTRDLAVRAIAELERALEDGYPPHELIHGSRLIQTARRVAADRLGWNHQTARGRFGTPERTGAIYNQFKLKINWKKYKPRPEPEPEPEPQAVPPTIVLEAPAIPADPIETRKLKDENASLRSALKEAERRAVEAEARERDVLGLMQEPLRPQIVIPPPHDSNSGGRTVILHLSDIQYGETILAEEMDGLNSFNSTTAKNRLGRFFAHASDLMTEHWKGEPADEIVLCLGGDLISGSIHEELEITDFPTVPAAVREVGEHIAGGIVMLRNEVKRPIRVYSVPGNHGRSSDKPRSKRRASSSFDLLATDFCEAVLKGGGNNDVAFYKSQSPDAYFSVYGWHWLLTHGDTMGGRGGGTGFIGPMATIIKGHRKLVDVSWRVGKPVHRVLTGHYHTTGKTSFGWANGSVASYNEFARDLRADPEPASQNMLVVHPRRGVITEQPLYLGSPEEGSLYAGPATVVRPQWSDEQ